MPNDGQGQFSEDDVDKDQGQFSESDVDPPAPQTQASSPSLWQRLKSAVTPAPEPEQGMEGSIGNRFTVPGGHVPLQEGLSEASTLANVAALGMGGESPMGMPPADVAGSIGNGAGRIKDTLGSLTRTPEGSLKPSVRTAARIGGGAVGSLAGTGGTIVGGLAGPSLADAILPGHPNPTGWAAKLPARIAKVPLEQVARPVEGITKGIETETPVEHWPEPTQASTERPGGGASWSKEGRGAEGARAGILSDQEVQQRLGKKALIIPRPTIGKR